MCEFFPLIPYRIIKAKSSPEIDEICTTFNLNRKCVVVKKEVSTITVKMGKNSFNLEWFCNPWADFYLVENLLG